ncbi:AbrB/MazE/SpoVT family DNA-binding domain-containing protein [Salipaludibacillus aurantiacus]|uniref:SpoVT-AbrB domain-containing protein n=1 Tax=Salipaludibacillus aurantiacus TaxID=1601833 RepID=A0A1H9S597_9BACI|nr:AbrB/MazE/SpoVT family DNA-binding domain-containing protein [Salipaludibacillus aurantiacus]SER80108.1 hypothetical protein SAMN05518684_10431 [Salipaludibacillus aurantiacus]
MVKTYARRLDKMGRIVIPKEIREELELNDHKVAVDILTDNKAIQLSKPEKQTEETESLDDFGRLVISDDIREDFDWSDSHDIEFKLGNDFVLLSHSLQVCELCGNTESLLEIQDKCLCEKCLDEGTRKRNEHWGAPLDTLVHDFTDACKQAADDQKLSHLQQAKAAAEQLQTLFQMQEIPSDHQVLVRLKEVDNRLGKLIKQELFAEDFEARHLLAEKAEDNKLANLFAQMHQLADKKRNKQRKKVKKRLPQLINDEFLEEWKKFKEKDLSIDALSSQLHSLIEEEEQRARAAEVVIDKAAEEKGENSVETLEASEHLLTHKKRLQAVYSYLGDVKDDSRYKEKAENLQSEITELCKVTAVKDRVKEFDKRCKKLDGKKKHMKEVKQALMEEIQD